MVSTKVDMASHTALMDRIQNLGEHEVARMASLSLPQAGAWLNCPPLPALGLHLRGSEFVVAARFRLGMSIYNKEGKCPACGADSDIMGDHGLGDWRGAHREAQCP